MKGIVLSGGSGTRLYPLTLVSSKQLMPIYDKPMVYYPISALMMAGIKEVLIISTPHDLPQYRKRMGDGKQWGMRFEYVEQPKPEGLAQALILAKDFLQGEPSCLVLGDNLFYGHGLPELMKAGAKTVSSGQGSVIFGYPVNDPHRYGIVEFDANGKVLGLEEKPKQPKSNFAVPGLYFYDGRAPELAAKLKPSVRGELEITDLNLVYLREGTLRVELMGRGMAWLDTGTHESLLEASQFISIIEKRQGLKVGCPEEIAYRQKFITREQLIEQGNRFKNNEYGAYLLRIAVEPA